MNTTFGNKSAREPGSLRRGFTMIEMLVVFGVIAILAGLIVAVAGHAKGKARLSRAQTELRFVEAGITAYKGALGSYPPDHPNDPAHSALFYELTGTVMTLDGGNPPSPLRYYSPVSGETLNASDLKNIFGVDGFANTTTDVSQVRNFATALRTSEQSAKLLTLTGITNSMLGLNMAGPGSTNSLGGHIMVLWNYVATNPTNNPTSYDLWVDISVGATTYRVSNWSAEPQPL